MHLLLQSAAPSVQPAPVAHDPYAPQSRGFLYSVTLDCGIHVHPLAHDTSVRDMTVGTEELRQTMWFVKPCGWVACALRKSCSSFGQEGQVSGVYR